MIALRRRRGALAAILVLALAVRLVGIRFGLPSLYDADEGFFIITGVKLLREQTLNPGWFGHPGTITLYSVALVEAAVVAWNLATGRFVDLNAFGRAMYLDPGIVLVPLRLMIVACGVAGVAATWAVARRVWGEAVALGAALGLALCALHIALSQVVRTDIQVSLFMLAATWFAVRVAETGRPRDYLLAGMCAGLACATKWPGATVIAAVAAGCAAQCRAGADVRRQAGLLALAGAAMAAALVVASPFLLLDAAAVARDLGGEAQASHVGATGHNPLRNLGWYLGGPMVDAFGWPAVMLAAVGAAVSLTRPAAWPLLAAAAAFLIGIASPRLIWARWLVPVLPFIAMFAAAGLWWLAARVRGRARTLLAAGLAVAVLVPLASAAVASARERLHDTRDIGEAWLIANVRPGESVLAEYMAIRLMAHPWRFRFPAGDPGCIDPLAAARGQIDVRRISRMRGGRAVVDIGTVGAGRLGTCRADYAILTNYDRYRAEPARYAREIASYRALMRGGQVLLTVRPVPGERGGPTVRIVRLGPQVGIALTMVDKPRSRSPQGGPTAAATLLPPGERTGRPLQDTGTGRLH